MPRHQMDHVARAPLFDRLCDYDGVPREARPFRTLTYAELLGSVRREVQNLLNTRASWPVAVLAERDRSVLDYGASDFTWVGPLSPEDQDDLERHIATTISAYEPRLQDVWIQIDRYETTTGTMHLTLSASLVIDDLEESVSFPLAISATGKAEK